MEMRGTSPTWGPPPACKQALRLITKMAMILIFVDVASATIRPDICDILHFFGKGSSIFIREMSGNREKGCLQQLRLSFQSTGIMIFKEENN